MADIREEVAAINKWLTTGDTMQRIRAEGMNLVMINDAEDEHKMTFIGGISQEAVLPITESIINTMTGIMTPERKKTYGQLLILLGTKILSDDDDDDD